jgi:hypothetical protein
MGGLRWSKNLDLKMRPVSKLLVGLVEKECYSIRELMKNAPLEDIYMAKGRSIWTRMWSAIDCIEDTDRVLSEYISGKICSNNPHLVIYGILNALVMQQESIESLFKVLQLSYTRSKLLQRVRGIRVAAAGHPSSQATSPQRRNKPDRFNFLVYNTIRTDSFELQTVTDRGRTYYNKILVQPLVSQQLSKLAKVLRQVVKALKAQKVDHLKTFGIRSLTTILSVSPGRTQPTNRQIRIMANNFVGELNIRGQTSLARDWKKQIRTVFNRNNTTPSETRRVQGLYRDLKQAASEIDVLYATGSYPTAAPPAS